jgi:hypothetical protein
VAALPVQLAALITPANSTAQIFASSSYYGEDWSAYGRPQVVPFFLGPQGIVSAIDQNSTDPSGVVVLASGWGAGQTGTALATMQAKGDPALKNVHPVVPGWQDVDRAWQVRVRWLAIWYEFVQATNSGILREQAGVSSHSGGP